MNLLGRVYIKYVRAANAWCKTTFVPSEEKGKLKQVQEWFAKKPV